MPQCLLIESPNQTHVVALQYLLWWFFSTHIQSACTACCFHDSLVSFNIEKLLHLFHTDLSEESRIIVFKKNAYILGLFDCFLLIKFSLRIFGKNSPS